ncbi:RES family NAD+ phosphorylase [Pseudobacteriovorax antillogorgiicola]|uniref:RES domain-containing protein n=1 Tax=Pseudobacteriovorax antillogorgiicola TaxID=1513793 RepID=A0A1Y6BSP9_9BACT|nr:RES family NAD+ phosphorylase [Pseudobacteriovorax antillogorgiicola]TCS54584.1 RES domain-containing protein [Pseudobacteriovorax antillogorgiicola]SMF17863.1 RES domain-containing protein [Pseudobacteriovorax antillogorgiicola]
MMIEKAPYTTSHAYRNIPTNHPKRHLYGDDLTEDEIELVQFWADHGSGIDQDQAYKDRWYDYNDPEDLSFCFEGVVVPPSRYTDGSFPVWYAAIDKEEASRAEIIYHLCRQARVDMVPDEAYVCYQRAMCKAAVENPLVGDLRSFTRDHWHLHDDPPYFESQKIGLQYQSEGYEGLLYPSKRYPKADCLAIFNKQSILSSKVVNFFTVEVYRDAVTVCGEPWQEL